MHFFMAGADAPADMSAPSYRRDPFRCHLSGVETLAAAGIEPPSEWSALLDRFANFTELGATAADRLAAELVHPCGGDIVSLRAAALAEEIARTGDDSAINTRIQATVLRELEALYEPVAQHNYKLAAGRFDAAGKRFVDCARAVDVEANGEALVTVSPGAREAWLQAPAVAGDLEEALRVLFAAAALAGARDDVAFVGGATDVDTTEVQIALACDPGKAHRRRVWEAWATKKGRCARWGALAALGVRIRAASDPVRVERYERPAELVAVTSRAGKARWHDPHDGELPQGWVPVGVGWIAERPTTSVP